MFILKSKHARIVAEYEARLKNVRDPATGRLIPKAHPAVRLQPASPPAVCKPVVVGE